MSKKKKKKELKTIISVTIEPARLQALRKLAQYTNTNLSKALRSLLPCPEAVDCLMKFQDFKYSDMPKKHILKLFGSIHRENVEQIMINHPVYPLRLQVKATSYFDKTGVKTFHLFQTFVKALQGEKGYWFQTVTLEKGKKRQKFQHYVVLAPKTTVNHVNKLIGRYFCDEGDVVLKHIKLSRREWEESNRMKRLLSEALWVVFSKQIRVDISEMFNQALLKEASRRKKAIRK